jgi:phosphoglycerate dehydrogenase-like enzyme
VRVRVLVPDPAGRRLLEPPPAGVELSVVGAEPRSYDAEWLVAAPELEDVAGLMASLPRLRVVQSVSAGVDWLLPDVPAGVTVCDAAGVHDIPVAEWTVAAILAGLKRLGEYRDLQRHAAAEAPPAPVDLDGRRVLIVGHGSIGRAVAARLAPFGAEVQGVARRARPGMTGVEDLVRVLPGAEVVVVLVPLTRVTEGMVDAAFLSRLPDGALLVNAGRGRLVDQDALLDELRRGRLRAVLDVTDPEPLPSDHPLRSVPGVFLTPHIAGRSPGFPARAYGLVREQLERELNGEPLRNVVEHDY